jgi:predicted amidohydrolase YtcJ
VIICQGSFQLEEKVIEKRYPTKAELDGVAPDNPVLIRASAHVYILNSMALKVANITRDTADPRGAQIERNSSGEPTGVLREFHKYLSLKSYTAEEMRAAIKQFAYDYYIKRGVTSVYDLPFSSASIAAYQELTAEKELPLRFRVAIMIPHVTDLDCFLSLGLRSGFGNDQISIGGVKIFLDGDADTAAVYEHFSGPPDFYGLLAYSQEELDEIVMKVHEARMQIMIHAVGDRAQDMALDAIEAAIKKVPRKDHRHRIEHLGDFFCTKERIKRVKELGVIPVVTPAFPYDCGEYYKSRIGPNGPQLCGALRSMLDEGLLPPGSSDCVGSIPNSTNPFFNIWCAVTRETVNGHIVCPEERISILEGIRMYTVNSAYSGFEEKIKGTIEPGKLADLIVLSDNPLSVSEGEIKNIGVVMTVIGGRTVYEE